MCGEKRTDAFFKLLVPGSPPHVRGKASGWRYKQQLKRITPACAGKSPLFALGLLMVWDHPRMCGEKETPSSDEVPPWGSPPHVRGKGKLNRGKGLEVGITPACAGKR